jgi:hypothetical protein
MKIPAFLAAFGIAAFMGLPATARTPRCSRGTRPPNAPAGRRAGRAMKDTDRVKAELKKRVPEANVDSVRKVPYGGLYEVVVGGDIFLHRPRGEFLVPARSST